MGVSRLPVPFPVVLDCIVCNLRVSTRCRRKLGLFLRLKGAAVYMYKDYYKYACRDKLQQEYKQLENGFELSLRFSFRLFGISDGKGLLKRWTDSLTRFTNLRYSEQGFPLNCNERSFC